MVRRTWKRPHGTKKTKTRSTAMNQWNQLGRDATATATRCGVQQQKKEAGNGCGAKHDWSMVFLARDVYPRKTGSSAIQKDDRDHWQGCLDGSSAIDIVFNATQETMSRTRHRSNALPRANRWTMRTTGALKYSAVYSSHLEVGFSLDRSFVLFHPFS